jgi:uncharacterized protein
MKKMNIQRFIIVSLTYNLFVFQSCSFNKYFYNTHSNLSKIEANSNFHELSLVNKNNDTLHGIFLNPDQNIKGTVLLIHGNTGDVSRWIEVAKPLFYSGYRVLVFDYEGYGESTGKPTHKNVVSDTELFLDYLTKKYGKVILWGLSLGGNLSVDIAYRNIDKVEGLIVEGAFTSHNAIVRTFVPPVLKPFVAFTVRSPYKSKTIIKKLHIPILIAHSPTDKVVPFEMGKTLYKNANEPKFFLELKGEHCFGIKNNTKEYLEMIDRMQHAGFMNKNL